MDAYKAVRCPFLLLKNIFLIYSLYMIITYHGVDFFKVSFGDTTIAVNPISKESKHKSTRFGSDITLVSLQSPEHNGTDVTSRGDKESFLIKGPGEYEVGGVFIKGFQSKSKYDLKLGEDERVNTIYTITLEGMKVCFLGALSDASLSDEAKEGIDGADIFVVPIGSEGVLDPAAAHKLAVQFGPKLIIPAHYSTSTDSIGAPDAMKKFLKEAGAENVKPIDKLTIKKKDLDGKEDDVVVLEAI